MEEAASREKIQIVKIFCRWLKLIDDEDINIQQASEPDNDNVIMNSWAVIRPFDSSILQLELTTERERDRLKSLESRQQQSIWYRIILSRVKSHKRRRWREKSLFSISFWLHNSPSACFIVQPSNRLIIEKLSRFSSEFSFSLSVESRKLDDEWTDLSAGHTLGHFQTATFFISSIKYLIPLTLLTQFFSFTSFSLTHPLLSSTQFELVFIMWFLTLTSLYSSHPILTHDIDESEEEGKCHSKG